MTRLLLRLNHITEPLPVRTILKMLGGVFGVEIDAFRQRRRNSPLRAVAARMLIRFGGLTQRQADAHLDMGTGGAVSARVRKLPGILLADRRLRRTVKQIERSLEDLRTEKYNLINERDKKGS